MNTHRIVRALIVIGMLWLGTGNSSALAQAAPAGRGAPTKNETSVAANDKYVYVVRGNKLYKFDAATLTLLRQASFPANVRRASSRRPRRRAHPARVQATHAMPGPPRRTRNARPFIPLPP